MTRYVQLFEELLEGRERRKQLRRRVARELVYPSCERSLLVILVRWSLRGSLQISEEVSPRAREMEEDVGRKRWEDQLHKRQEVVELRTAGGASLFAFTSRGAKNAKKEQSLGLRRTKRHHCLLADPAFASSLERESKIGRAPV